MTSDYGIQMGELIIYWWSVLLIAENVFMIKSNQSAIFFIEHLRECLTKSLSSQTKEYEIGLEKQESMAKGSKSIINLQHYSIVGRSPRFERREPHVSVYSIRDF